MHTMNYSEARQNLALVLETAATGTPVTITRRGHKAAVIISAEEFERYQKAKLTQNLTPSWLFMAAKLRS